jgi:predicted O-methyltransferase YrrM
MSGDDRLRTKRGRVRLGPLRPILARIQRPLIAGPLPRLVATRLRGSDDPRAPALARAAEAIFDRAIDPEEARWVERIERRRAELATGEHARLATYGALPRPWGRFLLRLVRELRPVSCLELGAGAGISAAYLGAGLELNGAGSLVTIERIPPNLAAARETLAGLSLGRADVRGGDIIDVLDQVLDEAAPVGLVFMDSLKRRDHVEWCVDTLLPRMSADGVLVLDDAHWSRHMGGVWRGLSRDPRFSLTADLWRLGVVCVGEQEN